MMVLVSYDVCTIDRAGRNRLRRVAKACQDYGIRVQNSVFECILEPAIWIVLKGRLEKIYDPAEDSLRFYFLGARWENRVEHLGKTPEIQAGDIAIL
jgi:CRISPR-associated protein Cas2